MCFVHNLVKVKNPIDPKNVIYIKLYGYSFDTLQNDMISGIIKTSTLYTIAVSAIKVSFRHCLNRNKSQPLSHITFYAISINLSIVQSNLYFSLYREKNERANFLQILKS